MALTEVDKLRLSKEEQQGIVAATNAWESARARNDEQSMRAAAATAAAIRSGAGYYTSGEGYYKGELTGNNRSYSSLAAAYSAAMEQAGLQHSTAQAVANAYAAQRARSERESAARDYESNNMSLLAEHQRAIDPYGYNAEAMAALGLGKSGYSETSRLALDKALLQAQSANYSDYNARLARLSAALIEGENANRTAAASLAYDTAAANAKIALELGIRDIDAAAELAERSSELSLREKEQAQKEAEALRKHELDDKKLNFEIRKEWNQSDFEQALALEEERLKQAELQLAQDRLRLDEQIALWNWRYKIGDYGNADQ